MDKELSMVSYDKENVFRKIKKILTNTLITGKNQGVVLITDLGNGKNKLLEEVIIIPHKEKIRLSRLMQDYQERKIKEEDISPEDYKKMVTLYDDANRRMQAEIERDKIEINKKEQLLKKMEKVEIGSELEKRLEKYNRLQAEQIEIKQKMTRLNEKLNG